VETPLDRMRWVMKARGWNESQWAKAAQLKERSNVNKILKRIEDTGEISGDMRTFVKLAAAAEVSLDWLLLGRGAPQVASLSLPDDPKYPARMGVLLAGFFLGVSKEVLDAVVAFDPGPADPGTDFWLQLLLGKRAEFTVKQAPKLREK
jgi:hypothetical protein